MLHQTHLAETPLQDMELSVEGASEDEDGEEHNLKHSRVHAQPRPNTLPIEKITKQKKSHLLHLYRIIQQGRFEFR